MDLCIAECLGHCVWKFAPVCGNLCLGNCVCGNLLTYYKQRTQLPSVVCKKVCTLHDITVAILCVILLIV
jgi:hypothetical protein